MILPTPRLENINKGQLFYVVERKNGQEVVTSYATYEEAKKHFNKL